MKKTLYVIIFLLAGVVTPLSSQSFFTPDDQLINGYARKVSGLDFEYHSFIPGLRESILVRATNGKDGMEWETDPVPASIESKYATFVWIAAIGSGPGKAGMMLSATGAGSFTFFTDTRSSWDISGVDGSLLSFRSVMRDQFGDHHGYMILRIPSEKTTAGAPIRVKVTGGAENLSSWYMTYRKQVRTGITLNSLPAILKNNGSPLQLVEASVFYFGQETEARFFADGKLMATATLRFGYN